MQTISTRKACELARAFDGVTEKDHFGSDAFVANGRIFATVWHEKKLVNLMLNQAQQREFLGRDGSEGFRPLENAWGANAIGVQLEFVDGRLFAEALAAAWENSKNLRSRAGRGGAAKPRAKKRKKAGR